MLGEGGAVVEGDGRVQAWIGPSEDGHHDGDGLRGRLAGAAGREHEPGLALLQDLYGPRASTVDPQGWGSDNGYAIGAGISAAFDHDPSARPMMLALALVACASLILFRLARTDD